MGQIRKVLTYNLQISDDSLLTLFQTSKKKNYIKKELYYQIMKSFKRNE